MNECIQKRHSPWPMRIAIVFLALLSCLVSTIFYYQFFEEPYLSYKNVPLPTRMDQVYPGEVIPMTVERCNTSGEMKVYKTTHTLHEVEKNLYYVLRDETVAVPDGCTTAISNINVVPKDIPAGRYIVFGTSEIHGKLRTHFVDWYSTAFFVIHPSGGRNGQGPNDG